MSTSLQLNEMVKVLKIKNYIGYFSKDEIPSVPPSYKYCFLCNFQNKNEPGSHHVAFWRNNSDRRYFDSFGGPILNEIRKLEKDKKIWNYQAFDSLAPDELIQDPNSDLCGELSVLFLFLCDKGFTFIEIINLLLLNK